MNSEYLDAGVEALISVDWIPPPINEISVYQPRVSNTLSQNKFRTIIKRTPAVSCFDARVYARRDVRTHRGQVSFNLNQISQPWRAYTRTQG